MLDFIRDIPDSVVDKAMNLHELISTLATSYPQQFKIHFGAKTDGVEHFWTSLSRTPQGQALWRLRPHLKNKSLSQL